MSTALNQFTGELDILGLGTGAGNDLQAVTDNGATTTNPITINAGTNYPALTINNTSTTNYSSLTIQSNGSDMITIGKTLGVEGIRATDGTNIFFGMTNHYVWVSDQFNFNAYNATGLHSFTGSKIQTDTGVNLPSGASSAPTLTFTSDTTTGLYLFGAGSIGVACSGLLEAILFADTLAFFDGVSNTVGLGWATVGRLDFQVALANEMSLTADKLTFQTGGTTTGIGWSTSGQLDFLIASTAVMRLANKTLTFEAGAFDPGFSWNSSGNFDITISGTSIINIQSSQVSFRDGINFVGNTGTGIQWLTATNQKQSWWGATPVVQPGATTDLGTVLSTLGLRSSGTAYPITTSGAVNFSGGLSLSLVDATILDIDIVLGTTTGTMLGTTDTQKWAAWGATPIVRPANTVALDTAMINIGLIASGGSYNIDNPGVANYVFNPATMAYFYDDFTGNSGTVGEYSWSSQASGTGATATNASGEANHPGIRRASTGTTATGYAGWNNKVAGMACNGGDVIEMLVRFSANTGIVWRGGLQDTTTNADNVDGYYFEFDPGTSANWRYVTANNSTRTKASSSTAVSANTWYKLKIVVNSANSSVEFFVNGSSVGTSTTNIPTSARTIGVTGIIANDGVATTSVDWDWDYVYFYNRTLSR